MPESYKEDGRPAQQWYWDDWFSAFDVRLCSVGARGLWIDMLGIMYKAEIRGTLTVNGRQIDSKTLAKIVGDTMANINKYLKELEDNDVFSRLEDNTIICRRMFRESGRKDQISQIRASAGKKGAKIRWQQDSKDMAKMAASSPSSSPIASSKKECSEKHSELATLLESKIKERLPRYKIEGKDYLGKWTNEFRIMEEKEEATISEIKELIIWIYKDDFWYKNILSAEKFRKQFGVLWEQMRDDKKKRRIQTPEEINAMQKKALEGK